MKTTAISPEQLCARIAELLTFDPLTGDFRWIHRQGRSAAGNIAGHVAASGYRLIGIDGVLYHAHRLAYLVAHGDMPAMIDHIDGDRASNAIANLRAVTHSQNAANMKRSRANRTGVKGVSLIARSGRYYASIMVRGRSISLGHYRTVEPAAAAYAAAAERYFGEFARTA
jgi:hypothetical protein